ALIGSAMDTGTVSIRRTVSRRWRIVDSGRYKLAKLAASYYLLSTIHDRRFPTWSRALALVALTIVTYLPAMRAGTIWDDDYYVTNNFNLRSGQGLIDLWTRWGAVPQYYRVTH